MRRDSWHHNEEFWARFDGFSEAKRSSFIQELPMASPRGTYVPSGMRLYNGIKRVAIRIINWIMAAPLTVLNAYTPTPRSIVNAQFTPYYKLLPGRRKTDPSGT